MTTAAHAHTEDQWRPPKNGASLRTLMAASLYPVDDEDETGRIRFTITLSKEQHADLQLVADIWNELDKALKKDRRKWKLNSVIERMISAGIDRFWNESGGRPIAESDRDAFVRDVAQRLSKHAKK